MLIHESIYYEVIIHHHFIHTLFYLEVALENDVRRREKKEAGVAKGGIYLIN